MVKKFFIIFWNEFCRIFTKSVESGHFVVSLFLLTVAGAATAFTPLIEKYITFQTPVPVPVFVTIIVILCTNWFLFRASSHAAINIFVNERKRNLLPALLVTPIPGKVIAAAKLVALSIVTLFTTLFFILGYTAAIYGFELESYCLTFAELGTLIPLILTTSLLIFSLAAVLALFFDSENDARAICFTGIFCNIMILIPMLEGACNGLGWRIVPGINIVQTYSDILLHQCSAVSMALTCLSNLLFTAGFAYLWTILFNNEKLQFKS